MGLRGNGFHRCLLSGQQEVGAVHKACNCVFSVSKAIESFALMVKHTAQMLQSFGTELAETELPNDVQSTSSVLCAHTEKKDKAKVCGGAPVGGCRGSSQKLRGVFRPHGSSCWQHVKPRSQQA